MSGVLRRTVVVGDLTIVVRTTHLDLLFLPGLHISLLMSGRQLIHEAVDLICDSLGVEE